MAPVIMTPNMMTSSMSQSMVQGMVPQLPLSPQMMLQEGAQMFGNQIPFSQSQMYQNYPFALPAYSIPPPQMMNQNTQFLN